MKRLLGVMLVTGLCGTFSMMQTARATVVIQPSLEQMTQKSDVIIRAVVEEQSVVYAEGNARILTLSRLRVKDGIKGVAKANDTVTLYQVGGTKDGRTMSVVGVNSFTLGEEVVLFGATFIAVDTIRFLQTERKSELPAATLNPSAGWMVTYGIGLGKYQVLGGNAVEQIGDVVAAPQPGTRTSADPMAAGGRLVKTQQPLDVFLSEVRRITAAGRAP